MKLKKKDYELIHSIDFIHRQLDIKDLKRNNESIRHCGYFC